MAHITLESIQTELAEYGWIVVSDKYVNLKTEMTFQCEEGHNVYATWAQIRQKRFCPVCAQNQLKNPIVQSHQKPAHTTRILALDQASHISGWSIYDNKKLITYGTFEATGASEAERMHSVNEWLQSMLQNWQPDVVGIEGIQYQAQFGVVTFQTLARLQGILMETCLQNKIKYKICPTNTWRAHCGVKGKSRADKKASMKLLVKQWCDIQVSDDCADAIGIGKYVAETFAQQIEIVNWEQ